VKAVAVRELKNRLSQYLREVAAGQVVLVTDRGRVVAELRRPTADLAPGALAPELGLAAIDSLLPGLPQDKRAYRKTKVRIRRSTQQILDEERADR
jgi:antitoxin (DNA-binding transcriptional repressor) of toxin-antitoxin stability system